MRQALLVRRLRNGCCAYLTNYRQPIGRLRQLTWFFRSYRPSYRSGAYRIYLLTGPGGEAIGYGALQLRDRQLYITECIDAAHRGQGHGSAILQSLIAIAQTEGRELIAEIWASNQPSIQLHRRAGFELVSSRQHDGQELCVYRLPGGSASSA